MCRADFFEIATILSCKQLRKFSRKQSRKIQIYICYFEFSRTTMVKYSSKTCILQNYQIEFWPLYLHYIITKLSHPTCEVDFLGICPKIFTKTWKHTDFQIFLQLYSEMKCANNMGYRMVWFKNVEKRQ